MHFTYKRQAIKTKACTCACMGQYYVCTIQLVHVSLLRRPTLIEVIAEKKSRVITSDLQL